MPSLFRGALPEPLVSRPRDQETTGSGDENGHYPDDMVVRMPSTWRATSAIWRLFAELDKPKRTLSKMNLTSMQLNDFGFRRI